MNFKIGLVFSAFAVLILGIFNCMSGDVPAEGDGYPESPDIYYLGINATIDNNYAVTDITQVFQNNNDYAVDDTFSIQIPESAFISNFSLTTDGETHYAEVVPKEQAKKEYEEAKVSGQNAGLVESYGKSVFSYSVSLAPNQEMKVGLRYEQFLEKELGGYEYKLFASSIYFNSYIMNFEVNINIKSDLSITYVSLPDNEGTADIVQSSSNEAVVTSSAKSVSPGDGLPDLLVCYELESLNLYGKMLNYEEDNTGFFSHVFSPQSDELGYEAMDKDIIFVLDRSGSMAGTKISQLKTAFDEIVHELRVHDTFNIVTFNSDVSKYRTDLMEASNSNVDSAAEFINDITATGSTNINEALLTALEMFRDTSETVPIIVFLTDGLPTAGETNTATIRSNILTANTESVAIFSLGFGYDVDFEFLKALSLENGGHALRIEEGIDAGEQITNFYDTVSTPLLKDLKFEYMGDVSEVYPTYVDQLFEGTEVVIVGKYALGTESISCNIYATSKDSERTFSQSFELENDSTHSFIPRLWAYTKINYLLDEITVLGYDETLVGEVVNLAMEYEFVTPYTSLLIVVEEAKDERREAEEEEPEDPSGENKDTTTHGTTTHVAPMDDYDGDGVADNVDAYPYDPGVSDKKPSGDGGGLSGGWTTEESDSSVRAFGLIIILISVILVVAITSGLFLLRVIKNK